MIDLSIEQVPLEGVTVSVAPFHVNVQSSIPESVSDTSADIVTYPPVSTSPSFGVSEL